MELNQCINFLLTTAQHAVFQRLSTRLAAYDITPAHYGVLSCLWEKEFATPKQISEALCLDTSTISGVLDRMQKKDLIDRLTDSDDRRSVQVTITEKGRKLREPVQKIVDDVNLEVMQIFTEPERENLRDTLLRIAGIPMDEAL
ncbi:MAG: MarR family winged helix-turn-helix transcriptional regulator [Christensenellales bacterium]